MIEPKRPNPTEPTVGDDLLTSMLILAMLIVVIAGVALSVKASC